MGTKLCGCSYATNNINKVELDSNLDVNHLIINILKLENSQEK